MPDPKPHVILITYLFPPSAGVGGARPFRFYRYLQEAGYSCSVVTACRQDAGAPENIHFVHDALAEIWENPVKQRLSPRAHVERLLRWIIFPGDTGLLWSLDAAGRCRQIIAAQSGRRVVVFTTYPPTGALLAGLMTTLRERVPWICDFRDPLSIDPSIQLWSSWTRFLLRRLESLSFRCATAVIANVDGAAAIWRKMYPDARRKLDVIWNGFDPAVQPHARPIPPRPDRCLLHAGTLYQGRNPNHLVYALDRLRRRGMPEALSARVLLLGAIADKHGLDREFYAGAEREGWVEFRPPIPRAEAQRMTEEADGLVLLQPQSDIQVPGKLFEYVCVGRPILALAPRASAIERILEKSGVPYVCLHPEDDEMETDRNLLRFLQFPTRPVRASDWFWETFDGRRQTLHLASIIDEITAR